MKIELDLPEYDGNAVDVIWTNDSFFSVTQTGELIILKANQKALITFAKQMLYLAVNDFPNGAHVHYDSFFTKLENSSPEFVIEKIQETIEVLAVPVILQKRYWDDVHINLVKT